MRKVLLGSRVASPSRTEAIASDPGLATLPTLSILVVPPGIAEVDIVFIGQCTRRRAGRAAEGCTAENASTGHSGSRCADSRTNSRAAQGAIRSRATASGKPERDCGNRRRHAPTHVSLHHKVTFWRAPEHRRLPDRLHTDAGYSWFLGEWNKSMDGKRQPWRLRLPPSSRT